MDKKAKAAPIDWEAIEKDYRAGVLSGRQNAKIHGVSETAIRKQAKEQGWEKDLTEKVNQKVRAELVRTQVRTANTQDEVRTEREIVEHAASMVVQVVREHRQDISSGRNIVKLLMTQLHEAAKERELLEIQIESMTEDDQNNQRRDKLMKAIAIPAHAATVRDLSTAMKNLVYLERQAFNIGDAPPAPEPTVLEQTDEGIFIVKTAFEKRLAKAT